MEQWFEKMMREKPFLVAGLQSHGITSASVYLEVVESLPIEKLYEVERFRFSCLLSTINREDPFQLVRIAPSWLHSVTMSQLELTVRCQNVLDRENINTVAELRNYELEEAMRWRNFGKHSAVNLSTALLRAIETGASNFGLRPLHMENENDDSWFDEMARDRSALFAQLCSAGIDSALTYMTKREELSDEVLEEIEEFRFACALRTINSDDAFQLVKVAPIWLLGLSVTQLELTTRCATVLKQNAIDTVSDLLEYQLEEAIHWKNFGKKSARDLAITLQNAIKRGARYFDLASTLSNLTANKLSHSNEVGEIATNRDISEIPLAKPLRESLQVALGDLGQRETIVFQGRLLSYPRQTLEQIGYQLGVSRERVRQLEDRYLRALEKRHFFPMLIALKISKLLNGRATPLYLDTIHEEDSWFDGFSCETGKLSVLIRAFSEWSPFECDHRFIVSTIGEDDFENLKRKALESLRKSKSMSLKRSEVDALLGELAMEAGAPELDGALSRALQDQLHFTSSPDESEPFLSGVGWGVRHTVFAVLNEAERPLHFSELTQRCSAKLGREVEERRVHNVLITDNAGYFGRGTYGTRKHVPFGQDVQDEVRRELENIILSGPPGRQWHAAELVNLLGEKRPDLPEEVDKYLVNILLEGSSQLESLGRFVWVSATNASDVQGRIEIMELCSEILNRVGRPMRMELIRAEIEKERGTGDFFIISVTRKVTRVRPGVWGLVDRDFFTTEDQRCQILDTLFRVLSTREVGLHESELRDSLPPDCPVPANLTDYMLISLAQSDERFNLHHGGIIALREWGEPRRLSVRQAFEEFASQMEKSYLMSDIVRYVERAVARKVEKRELYAMLNQYSVVYDSATGTYQRDVSYDLDDESADQFSEDSVDSLYHALVTTLPL